MTPVSISSVEQQPMTPEEMRNRTALHVACDLISRGLQARLCDLQIALIQVVDSGLLDSAPIYKDAAQAKIEEANSLNEQIEGVWPISTKRARGIYLENTSAQQAIDYFRQEHFWTKGDIQSLSESESLIRKIVGFYSRVDYLLREIDADNEEQVLIWNHVLPLVTPNPYAAALEN